MPLQVTKKNLLGRMLANEATLENWKKKLKITSP
jgi:hypothetical protein